MAAVDRPRTTSAQFGYFRRVNEEHKGEHCCPERSREAKAGSGRVLEAVRPVQQFRLERGFDWNMLLGREGTIVSHVLHEIRLF